MNGNCNSCASLSGEAMLDAFIQAPMQLAQQITTEVLQYPSHWIGIAPVLEFPNFAGTELQRYIFSFRHTNPYYGLEGWRPVQGSFGEHDACALPPAQQVGWGLKRKSFGLMERRLATPEFCIRDIQVSYQGDTIFASIIKMLAVTSALERERLARNAYFIRSQKYVALPGFPQNTSDYYEFPLIPIAQELSVLTYHQLLYFYNIVVKNNPDHVLGLSDGMPTIGVACSLETWRNMIAEDDQLYQAIIRGPFNDPFLKKYNFMEMIGPFVHMPDYEVERFDRDASTGAFIPVSPTVNVPLERGYNPDGPTPFGTGVETRPNPHYEFSKYEAVKLILRNAFAFRVRPQVTELGGEGSFGPEPRMFEWMLAQPERCADLYRRKLWYEAYAEMGIDWGEAEPITIMVRRDLNVRLFRSPAAVPCIEVDDCEIAIPAQGCPCPKVLCVVRSIVATELLFSFDSPTGAIVDDPLDILNITGGFDSPNVVAVNGNDVLVDFGVVVTPTEGYWTEQKCGTVLAACQTAVRYDCACAVAPADTDAIQVSVVNPLRCTAIAAQMTATFGDGTTALMKNVLAATDGEPDGTTITGSRFTYLLDFVVAPGISVEAEVCARRGIKSLCCVPTGPNACPACAPVYTACDPEAPPPDPETA